MVGLVQKNSRSFFGFAFHRGQTLPVIEAALRLPNRASGSIWGEIAPRSVKVISGI
jgi:hypothetical protein